MKRVLDVVVEKDETGWLVGNVPALRGCLTQGRTIDEPKSRIIEAIELCLEESEAAFDDSFVGIYCVDVPTNATE